MITLLPLCGFLLAMFLMVTQGIGPMEIWLPLGMWFLSGLGITVGFHRLFAHRTFQVGIPFQVVLIILGSMAAQGNLIYWVALHRRHHQNSDKPCDPHSPHQLEVRHAKLRGFWHAHIAWMVDHDIPKSKPLRRGSTTPVDRQEDQQPLQLLGDFGIAAAGHYRGAVERDPGRYLFRVSLGGWCVCSSGNISSGV
ncbi:MAG: hypothetical protein ACRERU_03125 [Methylococcales bacterium]